MKRSQLFIPFAALVLTFAIAPAVTPAHAETRLENTTTNPLVSEHLEDFKSTVFQMRDEAALLNSYLLGNQISWQTHVRSLGALKDHVNELGQTLAQMEALKPTSGATQQMAIDNARPHLVAVAQNLTEAIELVNENRRGIGHLGYADAVKSVYEHSDSLYEKVDTILDYEAVRMRFDGLDLTPRSGEGS